MRLRMNLSYIAAATIAQGVGVYAYTLIKNNTEPGTVVRWIAVGAPCLIGLVTPLALELAQRLNLDDEDEEQA